MSPKFIGLFPELDSKWNFALLLISTLLNSHKQIFLGNGLGLGIGGWGLAVGDMVWWPCHRLRSLDYQLSACMVIFKPWLETLSCQEHRPAWLFQVPQGTWTEVMMSRRRSRRGSRRRSKRRSTRSCRSRRSRRRIQEDEVRWGESRIKGPERQRDRGRWSLSSEKKSGKKKTSTLM